jgi:hypothetical protein
LKQKEREIRHKDKEKKREKSKFRREIKDFLGFDKLKISKRYVSRNNYMISMNPCAEIPLDTSGSM